MSKLNGQQDPTEFRPSDWDAALPVIERAERMRDLRVWGGRAAVVLLVLAFGVGLNLENRGLERERGRGLERELGLEQGQERGREQERGLERELEREQELIKEPGWEQDFGDQKEPLLHAASVPVSERSESRVPVGERIELSVSVPERSEFSVPASGLPVLPPSFIDGLEERPNANAEFKHWADDGQRGSPVELGVRWAGNWAAVGLLVDGKVRGAWQSQWMGGVAWDGRQRDWSAEHKASSFSDATETVTASSNAGVAVYGEWSWMRSLHPLLRVGAVVNGSFDVARRVELTRQFAGDSEEAVQTGWGRVAEAGRFAVVPAVRAEWSLTEWVELVVDLGWGGAIETSAPVREGVVTSVGGGADRWARIGLNWTWERNQGRSQERNQKRNWN